MFSTLSLSLGCSGLHGVSCRKCYWWGPVLRWKWAPQCRASYAKVTTAIVASLLATCLHAAAHAADLFRGIWAARMPDAILI